MKKKKLKKIKIINEDNKEKEINEKKTKNC